MSETEAILSCENVWKLFGKNAERFFQGQFEAARGLPIGVANGVDLRGLAFERIDPIGNIVAGVQALVPPVVGRDASRVIGDEIPIDPHFHARGALRFHAIGWLPRSGMHFHRIPLFRVVYRAIAIEVIVRRLAGKLPAMRFEEHRENVRAADEIVRGQPIRNRMRQAHARA